MSTLVGASAYRAHLHLRARDIAGMRDLITYSIAIPIGPLSARAALGLGTLSRQVLYTFTFLA